jgi:hypothetical protein
LHVVGDQWEHCQGTSDNQWLYLTRIGKCGLALYFIPVSFNSTLTCLSVISVRVRMLLYYHSTKCKRQVAALLLLLSNEGFQGLE